MALFGCVCLSLCLSRWGFELTTFSAKTITSVPTCLSSINLKFTNKALMAKGLKTLTKRLQVYLLFVVQNRFRIFVAFICFVSLFITVITLNCSNKCWWTKVNIVSDLFWSKLQTIRNENKNSNCGSVINKKRQIIEVEQQIENICLNIECEKLNKNRQQTRKCKNYIFRNS